MNHLRRGPLGAKPTAIEVREQFKAARERYRQSLTLIAAEESRALRKHRFWKWFQGLAWAGGVIVGAALLLDQVSVAAALLLLGLSALSWHALRRSVLDKVRQDQPEIFKGLDAGRSLAEVFWSKRGRCTRPTAISASPIHLIGMNDA